MNAAQSLKQWPWPAVSLRASVVVSVLLVAAGLAAALLAPTPHAEAPARRFEQSIPTAFGDWKVVQSPVQQVDPTITRAGETSLNQPYDDVLARTYRNSKGETVMLSLAYGRQQRQEVKIHRPDLCYTAQGFKVVSLESAKMPVQDGNGSPVMGKRMKAVRDARVGGYTELVSYWMRIGSVYSESAWETRMHILKEGVEGRVPDGVLVRASRVVPDQTAAVDAAATHDGLEQFLLELLKAAPADARGLLIH